MHHTKN
ncbi:hypothetical protein YPPY100_0407, partial [Yersinia pestis PY-100]